jgi:hypothetical protein
MDPTGGKGTRGTLPGVTGTPGVIGTTAAPPDPGCPAITEVWWISAGGKGPIGPGRILIGSKILFSTVLVIDVYDGAVSEVVAVTGLPLEAAEELPGRIKGAPLGPGSDTPLYGFCRYADGPSAEMDGSFGGRGGGWGTDGIMGDWPMFGGPPW